MQAALSATPAVLTIELTPEFVMNGQRPPEPLTRDSAEVLATAIGDDLRRILGDEVHEAGLILLGASYDITEVLQPGLPMAEALLDIYRGSLRGGPFEPHLLALGTANGRFPVKELAPKRMPGSGPLLLLPFALVAPGPQLDSLSTLLEERLIERGRASLKTDQLVRQLFGLQPVHLSFASFHDLSALMKVQLEHAGMADFWTLLEGALYRADELTTVNNTDTGNRFLSIQGQVWTPYLSFGEWARREKTGEASIEGYGQWLKTQRQYMAGLSAHGLEVINVLPRAGVFADNPEVAISVAQQATLTEPTVRTEVIQAADNLSDARVITMTEQSIPGMGPFAYTVIAQAENGDLIYLGHEYPLIPDAIPAIRSSWQSRAHEAGATFHMEQPGTAITGGDPVDLMPYLDYDGTTH